MLGVPIVVIVLLYVLNIVWMAKPLDAQSDQELEKALAEGKLDAEGGDSQGDLVSALASQV